MSAGRVRITHRLAGSGAGQWCVVRTLRSAFSPWPLCLRGEEPRLPRCARNDMGGLGVRCTPYRTSVANPLRPFAASAVGKAVVGKRDRGRYGGLPLCVCSARLGAVGGVFCRGEPSGRVTAGLPVVGTRRVRRVRGWRRGRVARGDDGVVAVVVCSLHGVTAVQQERRGDHADE